MDNTCKCGCGKFPTFGCKGKNYNCLTDEEKKQVGNKRQLSNRNRARRTNLKRKVYLAQSQTSMVKKPLKRKLTPIPKISKSMAIKLREYVPLKKQFLKEHPICMAALVDCTVKAVDIHHMAGRIGKRLTDVNNFLAVCRSCHLVIEENPNMAKIVGLSLSRLLH